MPRTTTITKVIGREILDSRGNPTVEAIASARGVSATAAVPSGASTGTHEALELRDRNSKRYNGLGVLTAVKNIDDLIGPKLRGLDPRQQSKLDELMIKLDGTPNKSHLGANAILAVSLAVAKLSAQLEGISLFNYLSKGKGRTLPVPVMNVINGGKHAGTGLKMQEFMIIPTGAKSFSESLRIGVEIYHALKGVILAKHGRSAINVGDEGGFAPPLSKTTEALELILQAISEAGYSAGKDAFVGVDAASSEFYENGTYGLDDETKSSEEMMEFYIQLTQDFPILYLEDPFEQEDFEHTAAINQEDREPSRNCGRRYLRNQCLQVKEGNQRWSC